MARDYKTIRRIIFIGAIVNIFLTIIKIFAGIYANSKAMIADGIHSLSDLATDIVVYIGIALSSKPEDHNHKYGHGKFETLAASILGIILILIGGELALVGIKNLIHFFKGGDLSRPGIWALIVASVSILSKEILFRFTLSIARKEKSKALEANAWHHRSDVMSSIGAFFGIGGAIFLGNKFLFLDPLVAVIVSIFIIKVGVDIMSKSVNELLETSLTKTQEREIIKLIKSVKGVYEPHNLKTRSIGNSISIDVHIRVDKDISVEKGHKICTKVESLLKTEYGDNSYLSIHIEPFYVDDISI